MGVKRQKRRYGETITCSTVYLWEAALLVNEGDDVEWFCRQQVEDLLVVCELNVLPPDVFLVVLRLEGGGTR